MSKKIIALAWMFFALGFTGGTFASRLVELKGRLELGHSAFGWVMLLGSTGSVVAALCMPHLLRYIPIKRLLFAAAFTFYFITPVTSLSPYVLLLGLALFVQNGASSLFNVSMNKMAVLVERDQKTSIMSRMHGICSLGAMSGTVVGSTCVQNQINPVYHVVGATALLTALTVVASLMGRGDDYPAPDREKEEKKEAREPLPKAEKRQLIALGLTVACTTVCEGAMSQWSGVFLKDRHHLSLSTATWAVSVFTGASLLMRLVGPYFIKRYASKTIVTVGNLSVVLGVGTLLFSPSLILAFLGIVFIGLGTACVVPIIFREATDVVPAQSDFALAQMTNACYAGALAGPPLIGNLASMTSLQTALVLPGVLAVAVCFGSRVAWPAKKAEA